MTNTTSSPSNKRREYGAVLRLRIPGNLTTRIRWDDRPTKLEFLVLHDRMVVRQNGKDLASAPLEIHNKDVLKRLQTTWGRGVFGRFSGRLLKKSQDSAREDER